MCVWNAMSLVTDALLVSPGFHRGTDLRRHLGTHTGQKPHACPQCSMHFTTSYSGIYGFTKLKQKQTAAAAALQ